MPQYATCMGQSEMCVSLTMSLLASTNGHQYAGIETQTQPLAMQPNPHLCSDRARWHSRHALSHSSLTLCCPEP